MRARYKSSITGEYSKRKRDPESTWWFPAVVSTLAVVALLSTMVGPADPPELQRIAMSDARLAR